MKWHLRIVTFLALLMAVVLLGTAPAAWAGPGAWVERTSSDSDSEDSDSEDSDSEDSDSEDGDSEDGDSEDGDSEDGDSEEVPFDVATVFFELNNTDGDLGIHALVDGGPWTNLSIETPDERENLSIRLRGSMRQQGLTELFFESAEPTFDELAPEDFFARFPEGEYEVEGISTEGEELENVSIVTHLMPAPPEIEINGEAVPEDCDEDPVPAVSEPFTVSWGAITTSHPDLGRSGEPITVDRYQVVVEREEPTPVKITIDLPGDATSVALPDGLLDPGDEIKIEVLAREESGNQTATESCFEVED